MVEYNLPKVGVAGSNPVSRSSGFSGIAITVFLSEASQMAAVGINTGEFFSRQQTLDLLRKRVEGFRKGSKQNVALIGKEHIGKSPLLLNFYEELLQSPEIIPVYIELREEPCQLFEKRFIDSLLHCFEAGEGEDAEKILPATCPRLWEDISKLKKSSRKTQEQILKTVFDMVGALQQETGRQVVLMLDEFQKLSWFRVKSPFAMLGEKIMTQREVMYIVASSTVKRARDILDNDLSMLFGNFEVHVLAPPGAGESLVFLRRNLPGLDVPVELLNFLLCVTGRNPLHLESIAREIQYVALRENKGAISPEIVSEALSVQLCSPAASTHQYMLNTVNSVIDARSVKDLEILLAIAGGSKKSPQIAKSISKSASQTTRKLEKFVNADILVKLGQVYDYSDTLLKLWMRLVHGAQCYSFKPMIEDKEKKEIRKKIIDIMDLFVSSSCMELSERLRGLFKLFENDFIEFAGRALRFPKFQTVSEKTAGESQIPVFASAGKTKFWAVDYARETVTESQIMQFLGKLSHAPKTGMKIFLCCNGIDTNAKLLAKEKEIWLWTVHDLNLLCEIYEQPKFMV